jgi:hypothetical protein
MFIFDIEEKVDRLFDEVFPPSPFGDPRLNKRAYKPLLAESLGFIVPDKTSRRQIRDKEYFQIDQDDFLEFATSTLPKEPTLPVFPNERLLIYSFVNCDVGISTEYLGSKVQVSLLDAIIARHDVGVSVTARIAYKDDSTSNWIGFGTDRWEELITLTYFPSETSHPALGSTLLEWDRSVVLCPLSDDDEWRFVFADGPYAEYLKNEIEKDDSSDKFKYVASIVDASKKELQKYSVQIELARLCLCLPQYVAFMYDLVSPERVKAKTSPPHQTAASQAKSRSGVVYKIVKSIRVIRPPTEQGAKIVKWSSPKRRHLVTGHWRVYASDHVAGRDRDGNAVAGRTWITQHIRGKDRPQIPDVAESSASVTIHVKQTLESARDELRATAVTASGAQVIDIAEYQNDEIKKPSREWMARERAKLTAGLRYLVLKRDNFCCKSCGASPVDTNGVLLEVDHIRSIEQWGRTEIINLQTLCRACNRGKGARK